MKLFVCGKRKIILPITDPICRKKEKDFDAKKYNLEARNQIFAARAIYLIPNDNRFASKRFSQEDFPLAANGPFLCVYDGYSAVMSVTMATRHKNL